MFPGLGEGLGGRWLQLWIIHPKLFMRSAGKGLGIKTVVSIQWNEVFFHALLFAKDNPMIS